MKIEEALTKINKQLSKKVDNALAKEVLEAVKSEESEAIYSEVYGAYKPSKYRRRQKHGGLADPDNIKGSVSGGVLTVVNTTPPNPGGCVINSLVMTDKVLPELVEHGDGYKSYHYDFQSDGRYMEERPFTAKTVENLKKNGDHVEALKKGLKQQGLKMQSKP